MWRRKEKTTNHGTPTHPSHRYYFHIRKWWGERREGERKRRIRESAQEEKKKT